MADKKDVCEHGYHKDANVVCPACADPNHVPEDGWLFYITRPVAVMVKGTFAEAKTAQEAIKDRNLEEQYVRWYDDIPNVSRVLMTEDPPEGIEGGRIEEY